MTHEKKAKAGTKSVQQKPPSPSAKRLGDLVSNKVPRRTPPSRMHVPQRIPLKELEPTFAGAIPAIDEVVMQPVRGALRVFSDDLVTACIERRLLPRKVNSAIETAAFVSKWLMFARAAQVWTYVPASILLAEIWFGPSALTLDPYSGPSVPGNDLFERGGKFASLGAALLDHASYLATERRFRPVILARRHATGECSEYISSIAACKLWEKRRARDRADFVSVHGLQELDALPLDE